MPWFRLSSDLGEARHQPRFLDVEAIGNLTIEARTAPEPVEARTVKDEERLHISKAIPLHLDPSQPLHERKLRNESFLVSLLNVKHLHL